MLFHPVIKARLPDQQTSDIVGVFGFFQTMGAPAAPQSIAHEINTNLETMVSDELRQKTRQNLGLAADCPAL